MIEIIAYEMKYVGNTINSSLKLNHYDDSMYDVYVQIYNECFYEMRKTLEVQPYNFYSSPEQLTVKKDKIHCWIENNELIGSVACNGNEIDDLIVNKKYRGRGYGEQLLHFAISHIQDTSEAPIKLHVAKWNEKAIKLYEKNGFKCVNVEKIRRDI